MLDEFFDSYIKAALWSSTDNSTPQGGEPLDKNYSESDIEPETLAKMKSDCESFLEKAQSLLDQVDEAHQYPYDNEEIAGHDFWLTRNGHGAGFWDGDWPDGIGEALTEIAKEFGEFNLYVGDNGQIDGD